MLTSIVINSLTIGTVASGYLFTNLNGFGFPETRVDVKNRGNYDGAKLGNYRYGKRVMAVEGNIYGTSPSDYEDKRQALEKAVRLDDGLTTMTINTRGGLTLESEVILNAMFEAPYSSGNMVLGRFRIELVAPYPWLKGSTENSQDVDVFSGGGGTLPATLPMSLGVGGTGAETINNAGNGKAYPVIKIYGEITKPSLRNETTDKSFSLNYTLSNSTDYIEIDIYNRTVLLNGISNLLQYFSGDWFALEPGNNEIKLTGTNQTASAKAVVEWRHHYLGI